MVFKRKLNKIAFSLTLALALLVGAFVVLKVNADTNLDNTLFVGADVYSWSINDLDDVGAVIGYYQEYYYNSNNWSNKEDITLYNNVPTFSSSTYYYYHTQSIPYYYSLVIPNYEINTGFTISFSGSGSSDCIVDVLFTDNSFQRYSGNVSFSYFPDTEVIKAIGILNVTEVSYCTTIFTANNEKLDSNMYFEGYSAGYQQGNNDGRAEQQASDQIIIDGMQATIDSLNAQLSSDDHIKLQFFDLLNNIVKFPVKAIKSIFYNEEPIIDEVTGEPVVDEWGNVQYQTTGAIELFGVNIIGVVVGIVSIGLCITIIAIVKKVWK